MFITARITKNWSNESEQENLTLLQALNTLQCSIEKGLVAEQRVFSWLELIEYRAIKKDDANPAPTAAKARHLTQIDIAMKSAGWKPKTRRKFQEQFLKVRESDVYSLLAKAQAHTD